MKIDPLVEWQRLTETYGKMYDAELLELAAAPEQLTDQARQVLRDEVRKRGLAVERPASRISDSMRERAAAAPGTLSNVPDGQAGQEDVDLPREYTWKTPLCGCGTQEEAQQLSEALRRAGVENWIARPGGRQSIVWTEQHGGESANSCGRRPSRGSSREIAATNRSQKRSSRHPEPGSQSTNYRFVQNAAQEIPFLKMWIRSTGGFARPARTNGRKRTGLTGSVRMGTEIGG